MMATQLKWYGDKAIQGMEQAVSLALEASALLVEGQAKALAPVGKYPPGSGRVGGNLRDSITHEVEGQEAKVGTNVEYAPYVELGTVKMAAQPYLNPALEMNKNNIKRIFADAIKRGVGR
jgi:HK97 gp10 family phage protein